MEMKEARKSRSIRSGDEGGEEDWDGENRERDRGRGGKAKWESAKLKMHNRPKSPKTTTNPTSPPRNPCSSNLERSNSMIEWRSRGLCESFLFCFAFSYPFLFLYLLPVFNPYLFCVLFSSASV